MNTLPGEKDPSPGASRGLVQRFIYADFLYYTPKGIDKKDIIQATRFIPPDSLEDFNRLLKIIIDSGVDGLAALAALFRWIEGRPQYLPIHEGLERYFTDSGC